MPMPLEGIRVLDLSTLLPGPFCTMLLADMGADVIRVESPVSRFDPPFAKMPPERLAAVEGGAESLRRFLPMDRNKRSVAIDLKAPQGREVFYTLTKAADVVLEGFRPGVTERLGVDYHSLQKVNPRIIYCSLSGYGQTGPLRLAPGHDSNYLAVAGILSICGTEDGQPALPGVSIADLSSGMQAALAILMAYIYRGKTGVGQYIDISMTDAVLYMLGARHGGHLFSSGEYPPMGAQPPHVYECADGKRISIAVAEPWFWERTCKALGLEQYIPYLADVLGFPPGRPVRRETLQAIARAFKTRTRDEWLKVFEEADAPAVPVNNMKEAFESAHAQARDMLQEVQTKEWGAIKTVGIPLKMSQTPGSIRRAGPKRGEHTAEVLREAGYSEKQIASLRAAGAVK